MSEVSRFIIKPSLDGTLAAIPDHYHFRVPALGQGLGCLFGKVTNETLSEGIHLINPFKTNNEMSIQTQTIKESGKSLQSACAALPVSLFADGSSSPVLPARPVAWLQ